jgi:hypothetical protein
MTSHWLSDGLEFIVARLWPEAAIGQEGPAKKGIDLNQTEIGDDLISNIAPLHSLLSEIRGLGVQVSFFPGEMQSRLGFSGTGVTRQ